MTEKNIFTGTIKELYNAMRNAFFSKNIGFGVIRLAFIKYAVDNCVGALSREEMQDYMRVQRVFAARDISGGPNALVPVLGIIDRAYNLSHLMGNSINHYATELFGLDESWNRKNASDKDFEHIMYILSCMDLMEESESHKKGKALVEALIDNVEYHGENAKYTSPFYSRREIGIMASKILGVKDGETFLDFSSGIGATTIATVGNAECKIFNSDISGEALSVAAMLYIMYGYKQFTLKHEDCFTVVAEEVTDNHFEDMMVADKIFVDPPLGMKLKNHPLRDASVVAIGKAATSLKNGGTAVLALPSTALSGMGPKAQLIREQMVGSLWVQSVVAMPLTWSGTTVSINLLVLSKKEQQGILFVNFCNDALSEVLENNARSFIKKGGMKFSDAELEKMAEIVLNGLEIEGVSRMVSMNEVVKNEYNLTPNIYITQPFVDEGITLQEIDEKLGDLYARLNALSQN